MQHVCALVETEKEPVAQRRLHCPCFFVFFAHEAHFRLSARIGQARPLRIFT
jgi:hypothetical protein